MWLDLLPKDHGWEWGDGSTLNYEFKKNFDKSWAVDADHACGIVNMGYLSPMAMHKIGNLYPVCEKPSEYCVEC